MFYIIALGNPGKEYDTTRHNVGWLMADALRAKFNFSEPIMSVKYLGRLSRGTIGEHEVTLLYPDTYMNNSGTAAAKLVPKEERSNIIVLQDEIAIPIGTMKLSAGRGDGGHNGIRSLIGSLGTKDFARVRIGIAPTSFFTGKVKVVSGEDLPKFVLGRFNKRELAELTALEDKLAEAVRLIIAQGTAMAMNRFN